MKGTGEMITRANDSKTSNSFQTRDSVVLGLKALVLSMFLAGCGSKPSQPFEEMRSQGADAVLRVVVEEEFGGSAYLHVRAKVIRIIKNSTTSKIGEQIGIGYLSAGNGMPINEPCTVYLKCILQDEVCRWYLDESDLNEEVQRNGFSHVGRQ